MAALKQLVLTDQHLVVGNSSGRGSSLAPGSDGQYLGIVAGQLVYTDAPAGTVYVRKNFSEAGPGTAATASHTLTTTIPDTLQGGNKDSLHITINGLAIDLADVTLGGSGPYTVELNMTSIGYSLESTDKVFVSYNESL